MEKTSTKCKAGKKTWDICTYLTWSTKAQIPAASGALAEVPVWDSVQPLRKSVVTYTPQPHQTTSFLSHKHYTTERIHNYSALGQTPAYTARPQCTTWHVYSTPQLLLVLSPYTVPKQGWPGWVDLEHETMHAHQLLLPWETFIPIFRLQRISFLTKKNDEMTKTGRRDEKIYFWRNWRTSGFVAKFLTKFALYDKWKMAFLAAKSGGDLEESLSHKFKYVTF